MKVLIFLLLYILGFSCHGFLVSDDAMVKEHYMFWPNATVPFYINPKHFDQEQSLSIMTSLSLFAFKTCLKFAPVMVEPKGGEHVMVFENPRAIWRCSWSTEGHSIEKPHMIALGYECLKSPHIEMTIMKALGFPFEHNRASRDLFIDVQFENIEPGNMDLFTKDSKLPLELRNLPYDVNSAMHFGDRQFSKNGHRTIIFKDPNVKQFRLGLSDTDLRKIEIVYGPQCQQRDRQEKIDLCQVYPGVARRKRDLHEHNGNLRVNREIKPPVKNFTDVAHILNELGIEKEVEDIIDQVYKAAAVAIENARKKYCNQTKISRRDLTGSPELSTNGSRVVNIMDAIAKFTQSFVDVSIANLTVFCESMDAIEAYQRAVCRWGTDPRCQSYYKSTKSGAVKHSTQHRPSYYPSTKNVGNKFRYQYGKLRADDTETKGAASSDNKNETVAKKKREAHKEDTNEAITEDKTPKKEADLDGKAIEIGGETKTNSSDVSKSLTDKRKRSVRRSKDGGYRVHSHKRMKYDEGLARSREKVKTKKKKHYSDESEEQEERIRSKKKKVDYDLSQSQENIKRKKKIKDSDEREEREERIRHPKRGRQKNMKGAGPVGVPRTVKLSKRNKEFYDDRMWPGGVVRYVITEYDQYNLHDLRSRLERVNSILEKKTCVRLEEISEDEAIKHRDYLVLDTSPDYVTGRVGGRQIFGSVELFKGVSHKQHTAMMAMAMLGFYFEVSRHDRDDHIVVHARHIRPDKLHHFEKIRSDATLALPYDYKSATHPSWQFWRRIGKTGISSVATFKDKDPDGSIMKGLGQHPELLSELDIVKINSVYGVRCFKKISRDDEE